MAPRKLTWQMSADLCSQDQGNQLRSAFDTVDASGDGEICIDELRTLLQTLGQEHTDAELRDQVRQLDEDGSGSIDFEEFCALMFQWQEEELADIFAHFDDDSSGCINSEELGEALYALGQQQLTKEEVAKLAADVDSDGSGTIDADEFCVFMRPMMSITKRHEYHSMLNADDLSVVHLLVSSMGLQLTVGAAAMSTVGFAWLSEVEAVGDVLKLTITKGDTFLRQHVFQGGQAAEIAGVLDQHLAMRELRRDVALSKQKLQLRSAFDTVDASGDGKICIDELRTLLQTLGQEFTDAELRDKVRGMGGPDDADATSLDFEEFAAWMLKWQEEELRDLFIFFDDDESGFVSVDELSTAIQTLGQCIAATDADALAAYVDSDGSGEIDADEFCVFMRPLMSIAQRHTCDNDFTSACQNCTAVTYTSRAQIVGACSGCLPREQPSVLTAPPNIGMTSVPWNTACIACALRTDSWG